MLADAGHMLTDSTALIPVPIAVSLATRVATARRHRTAAREVLAALGNASLLVGAARWMTKAPMILRPIRLDRRRSDARRAYRRALANTAGLIWCAVHAQAKSLNMRGVYLEGVFGDLVRLALAVVTAAGADLDHGLTNFDAGSAIAATSVVAIIPRTWIAIA